MDETLSPDFDQDNHSQTALALAQEGNAEAQFGIGLRYANTGTASDYLKAAQWYLKAAEQSHPMAQFNLSVMYFKGQGVPRDKTLSLMWMGKAAQLGDAGAQYELGMRQHRLSLDLEPEGGLELRIEAYKWLQLAALQGYGESGVGCETVAMDMTHSGVVEGKRRAEIFVAG
jgi:TPR repeat protein